MFFFSSRRRHTRSLCDWSSDVCSSDLFRCIDLSFQLEDVKARQSEATSLNSSLKLEIAGLRNPMRIDVIARRQLGLTEPLPTQVEEYEVPDGAAVAAARYVRPKRAP